MASVFDVANFFITAENKREQGSMTNLRLNKLLYFAQVMSLLEYNQPLFCDDFEAWSLGPVIPAIYRQYKVYKDCPIETPEKVNYSLFTSEEIRLLFDVFSLFKNMTTARLVELSHCKDGPWDKAYAAGSENSVISLEDMCQFYRPTYEAHLKKKLPSKRLLALIPEAESLSIDG